MNGRMWGILDLLRMLASAKTRGCKQIAGASPRQLCPGNRLPRTSACTSASTGKERGESNGRGLSFFVFGSFKITAIRAASAATETQRKRAGDDGTGFIPCNRTGSARSEPSCLDVMTSGRTNNDKKKMEIKKKIIIGDVQ